MVITAITTGSIMSNLMGDVVSCGIHTHSYRDIVTKTYHSMTRVKFNLPSKVQVIGTLKESPNTTMNVLMTVPVLIVYKYRIHLVNDHTFNGHCLQIVAT